MPSVATWWCGQEGPFSDVAAKLSNLVIKPTFPAGPDRQPIFGARLSAAQREELLAADARHAGRLRRPGTGAAVHGSGAGTTAALRPRHLVLRVYVVAAGGSYAVMPGGLTRVSSSLDYAGGLDAARRRQQGHLGAGRRPDPQFSLLRPALCRRWR